MRDAGWSEAASREFDYRPGFRPRGLMPGAHRGLSAGAGHELRNRVSLLEHPDPRRLALRASLQDPFGQLHVHVFNQHSRIPVYAVLDVSASMGGPGLERKWRLSLDFLEALAFSAWRTGDLFGVVAAGRNPQPALGLAATRSDGLINDCLDGLRAYRPVDTGGPDLVAASGMLPATSGMVFLISDFHVPLPELEAGLAVLCSSHDVVPVVLWDPSEDLPRRRNGFVLLRDAETGRERHMWLRDGLRRRLQQGAAERRRQLLQVLRGYGLEPFFFGDRVEPDRLNTYFAER